MLTIVTPFFEGGWVGTVTRRTLASDIPKNQRSDSGFFGISLALAAIPTGICWGTPQQIALAKSRRYSVASHNSFPPVFLQGSVCTIMSCSDTSEWASTDYA